MGLERTGTRTLVPIRTTGGVSDAEVRVGVGCRRSPPAGSCRRVRRRRGSGAAPGPASRPGGWRTRATRSPAGACRLPPPSLRGAVGNQEAGDGVGPVAITAPSDDTAVSTITWRIPPPSRLGGSSADRSPAVPPVHRPHRNPPTALGPESRRGHGAAAHVHRARAGCWPAPINTSSIPVPTSATSDDRRPGRSCRSGGCPRARGSRRCVPTSNRGSRCRGTGTAGGRPRRRHG
jgi:hypothetical protein